MSDVTQPSANAYFFVIDASNGKKYDAWFDIKMYGTDATGVVRYRDPAFGNTGNWVYLTPEFVNGHDDIFDPNKMTTSEDTEKECDGVLDCMNAHLLVLSIITGRD